MTWQEHLKKRGKGRKRRGSGDNRWFGQKPHYLDRKLKLGNLLDFHIRRGVRIIELQGMVIYKGRHFNPWRDVPEEGWLDEEERQEFLRMPNRIVMNYSRGYVLKVEDAIGEGKRVIRYYSPAYTDFEPLSVEELHAKMKGQVLELAFYVDALILWMDATLTSYKGVTETSTHELMLGAKRLLREIEEDYGNVRQRTIDERWADRYSRLVESAAKGMRLRPHVTREQIEKIEEMDLPEARELLKEFGRTF